MKLTVRTHTRLCDLLETNLATASRTRIRKLLKMGSITVDGKVIRRPDLSVAAGQIITIRHPKPAQIESLPFEVVFEDPFLIAAEKPAGMLSIGTLRERSNTFYRLVNEYVRTSSRGRDRVFIVHRLDREVSGIMLFAKTPEAKEGLQKGWNGTNKNYSALVEGHPPQPEAVIRNWLKENRNFKVYSSSKGPGAKYAVTHYRELRRTARHALLDVRPETGRKHQIRVHLAELGCPIVGDKKYGAKGNILKRIGLHAYSLSIEHPISHKRMEMKIPIPKLFLNLGREVS